MTRRVASAVTFTHSTEICELRSVSLMVFSLHICFFFSSRRRHTRLVSDWSSDVCSSDLSSRGSVFALRASDGALVWHFFSTYPHGSVFTDVNGNTFDAGDTWTTEVTPNDTPNNCYLTGGATAWQHPTIDPELGLLYQAFGNVRSCNGSQNGQNRPGDNLFGSSVVALDLKTGAYKWHFQAVRHDIWDMDNALPPALADVMIGGQLKKVLFYGSKSGFQFTLDRSNGKPALPIEYRAVPADIRNAPALTQPFPLQEPFMPQCVALQNLR